MYVASNLSFTAHTLNNRRESESYLILLGGNFLVKVLKIYLNCLYIVLQNNLTNIP